MTTRSSYTLFEVLAVAGCHPFYSKAQYPPDDEAIRTARLKALNVPTEASLRAWPLLQKANLYATIVRLFEDASPQNTFRENVYMSTTGGGGTYSKPFFFCTDAHENRRQRESFGRFMKMTGLIKRGDLVLSVHSTGGLYRSLDLTLEIMENAGASALAAGNRMPPKLVIKLLQDFSVNALTGDGTQVIQIAYHVSTLNASDKKKIKLDKIIYTSEMLTELQKKYIYTVFGSSVKIFSVLGSAEAGPYGVSNPDISWSGGSISSTTEFLIDTRMTVIEVFPPSAIEDDTHGSAPDPLPLGQTGIIAQTSLTRLRNPLVRYLTGDIGSLHLLPEQARATIPEFDLPYLQILRLQGRDTRFSFPWNGEYIEFTRIDALMNEPIFGVLQWQMILDRIVHSEETSLEVRLLCSSQSDTSSKAALLTRLRVLLVVSEAEHKFRLVFVSDMDGFERSRTGQKVIRFIDRSTGEE